MVDFSKKPRAQGLSCFLFVGMLLLFLCAWGAGAYAADYTIEITPDAPETQTQSMLCLETQKSCFLALDISGDADKPDLVDVEARVEKGRVSLFFMYRRGYMTTSPGGGASAEIALGDGGGGHGTVTLYRPHPLAAQDEQSGSAVMRYSYDSLVSLGIIVKPVL